MASVQELLYVFPPAPSPEAVEWPGEPIGRSNVVTRTRSRTQFQDKAVDETPGLREHLVNTAIAHLVSHAGREPAFLQDVIIHGVRVRAITNSPHLHQFWIENWYTPDEWVGTTGLPVPAEPQITVYALGGVAGEREAAYYSRASNTVVFFNTSYYGQLKSWVLGAVGRLLAADFGIHSIHSACVERDGQGVLYIAPTGTGKSTSSYGLMSYPNTRFHSDDWVYVRYCRFTKLDELLMPIDIQLPDGEVIRGFRCNPWLDAHPGATGTVRCLGLDNRQVTVEVGDFDLSRPPQAYAYTSEKVFYLRSNLVENFPDTADAILRSNLENVPAPTDAFLRMNEGTISEITGEVRRSASSAVRERLGSLPEDTLRGLLSALFAFDNSRAMLDITGVFPPGRVYTNPMEPVHLTNVFLLKRDPADPVVLSVLSLERFMERLLIGQTPDGKREIAYNAYRAVSDEAEKRAVVALEAESERSGVPLYTLLTQASDSPVSLLEEFSLFRELYRSSRCYDLNTILQRAPQVTSKMEAVHLTLKVILRGIENRSPHYRLTLDDFRAAISS
jgi:hypothetical protein